MKKYYLYFSILLFFLSNSVSAQFSEKAVKILSGKWEGYEKQVKNGILNVEDETEKEPLKIEIGFEADRKNISVKRFFSFQNNGNKIDMIARTSGHNDAYNRFWLKQESIISKNKYSLSFPENLKPKPRYLFDSGDLYFYIEENKLNIIGKMVIKERSEYGTHWRDRNEDFKHQKNLMEYSWNLQKKIDKKEIDILKEYFLIINIIDKKIEKKADSENIVTETSNISEINLNDHNKEIKVKNENIEIFIFDNDKEDGDIISVFLNDKLVTKNIEVKKVGEKLNLQLKKGKNRLRILAENEGKFFPNTAALTFDDGINKQTIILNNKKGKSKTLKVFVD